MKISQCVGFKGFPQISVLSPFSHSFVVRCSMLQYADYLAVYTSHVELENVHRTVQSACAGLNEFFRDIGLSISESKP
jgi:hypothetical protein